VIDRLAPIWIAVCLALTGLPGVVRASSGCGCGPMAPALAASAPIAGETDPSSCCGGCCPTEAPATPTETPGEHDHDGCGCGCDGLCLCGGHASAPAVIRPAPATTLSLADAGRADPAPAGLSPRDVQLDLVRPPRS
jgi:hypothetical protein